MQEAIRKEVSVDGEREGPPHLAIGERLLTQVVGKYCVRMEVAQRQDGNRCEFVAVEETPQLNARGEEVYVHLSGSKGERNFSLIPENAER